MLVSNWSDKHPARNSNYAALRVAVSRGVLIRPCFFKFLYHSEDMLISTWSDKHPALNGKYAALEFAVSRRLLIRQCIFDLILDPVDFLSVNGV